MAESNGNGSGAPGTAAQYFALDQVYVKDLSFEAPQPPGAITAANLSPNIALEMRTAYEELGDDRVEYVVHVTARAELESRTAFIAEVQQAGVFTIRGFSADETQAIMHLDCLNFLFPYARETLTTLVQRGGFPPLVLGPLDLTARMAQLEAGSVEDLIPPSFTA